MVALESVLLFLFTTPPPTQTYPLSLHDALPIFDVIDEVGAMQMLVPPSKRKKTITPKEIEAVIATMARIPPKDRKSTRLNSSHVRISYAVFCLKKKKNNTLMHASQITYISLLLG